MDSLWKVMLEHRLNVSREVNLRGLEESILGSRNGTCKGPVVGAGLACVRNEEEAGTGE